MDLSLKSAGDGVVAGNATHTGTSAPSKADRSDAHAGAGSRRPDATTCAGIPGTVARALCGLLAMLHSVARLIDAVTEEDGPFARRRALCRDLAAKAIDAAEALEDAAREEVPDWPAVRMLAEEVEQLVLALATLHDNLVDGEASAPQCDGLLAVACDVAAKLAGELYTEPVRAGAPSVAGGLR